MPGTEVAERSVVIQGQGAWSATGSQMGRTQPEMTDILAGLCGILNSSVFSWSLALRFREPNGSLESLEGGADGGG